MAIVELTDVTYKNILGKITDTPTLLYFMAPWCAPCKTQHATIETLAKQYSEKLQIFSINVDTNPEIIKEYDITTVPSHKIIYQSNVIQTFLGLTAFEVFENAIRQYLK